MHGVSRGVAKRRLEVGITCGAREAVRGVPRRRATTLSAIHVRLKDAGSEIA